MRPRDSLPLCVDCDGTLIFSDLLFESFLLLVKKQPLDAIRAVFILITQGKAAAKLYISNRVAIDASTLPYDPAVLSYVKAQRAAGRQVVLVTASAMRYALAIQDHLSMFDRVFATETAAENLSSERKAKKLVAEFGQGGFEYIGNSADDLPVWAQAGVVSVVNARPRVAARAVKNKQLGMQSASPHNLGLAAFRAMRPHQWLKNLLIFLPILAAHRYTDMHALGQALLAFVAFSFCASSVYILNDMLDIQADRVHARKRRRPFAAGALSMPLGLGLKLGLLSLSFLMASQLPLAFLVVLSIYYGTTLAYSAFLKSQSVIDVMLLAGLYTVRVIGGAAATSVLPSFWLLAFSMFIFLSLALVKRYSELRGIAAENKKVAAGRGYTVDDAPVLLALGAASGYGAVMVLALYINSEAVTALYKRPEWLWMMVPCMLYWISRTWLKSHRGEVHDDPVVFAAKDRQSLLIVVLIGLIIAASSY